MPSDKKKKTKQLRALKLRKYRIYGIFDFLNKKLIYVDLNIEDTYFKFDLEGYDSANYGVVSFNVMLA
jgi:hypothetical protein